MLNPEERDRARKKAMRLLEHMDRTEKGLTDKLRQAEFSPEAVEDALAYVKSYGYINDARRFPDRCPAGLLLCSSARKHRLSMYRRPTHPGHLRSHCKELFYQSL